MLKNRIWYDPAKSQKIIQAETESESRTLLRGKYGNHFFQLYREGQLPPRIIPMSDEETYQFCEAHRDCFPSQRDYEKFVLLNFKKHMPKKMKEILVPSSAILIGEFDGEKLHYFDQAGRFYQTDADGVRVVNKLQALDWVEAHQEQYGPDKIEKVLNNYFLTTYRRS